MRGSSVAELLVACGLFSVFMVVSIGMFTSMTRVVRTEQQPSERLLEARVALLRVAQRVRNCEALVSPSFRELLYRQTDRVILRDGVLRKAVQWQVEEGSLVETIYPLDYDLTRVAEYKALDRQYLMPAREFSMTSGGLEYPTRVVIRIEMTDGREVKSVTNFREAL